MKPSFELTEKQREATKLFAGPQKHTLLVGGSRSGKTFFAVRAINLRALMAPESRHVIFRLRYNALRASIWLDTFPKVMRLCWPDVKYKEYRQDGFIEFPNQSQIWFGGLDEKERVEKILGQEYATLYFNETSQIPYSSVLTGLTRLAQLVPNLRNRAYYDLNPVGTGHWTYRQFIEHVDPITRQPIAKPQNYQYTYMNPIDNQANIDPAYIELLESMPERQRRRYLEGRYVSEIDGALWTLELLEKQRVLEEEVPKALSRIVIAVDPSGCAGKEDKRSDELGIAVCGVDTSKTPERYYVLADASGRYGPEQWAVIVAKLYRDWKADCVVGEQNYGGDMVRAVIHARDPNIRYKSVTATRGKVVRAEPISALYEQGRVHHAGTFSVLEDQMCNFSTAGYLGDRSPDRADAVIWALSELALASGCTGLLDFMKNEDIYMKRAKPEPVAA